MSIRSIRTRRTATMPRQGSRPRLSIGAVAGLTLALWTTADPAPCRALDPPSDEQITTGVTQRLTEQTPPLDRVLVRVDHGHVLLSGLVPTAKMKTLATQETLSVPGVQSIANNLWIETEPPTDQQMMLAVQEALQLGRLTPGNNIIVQVSQRVVTLTGAVGSQAQRADASRLAQTVPLVEEVHNQIEVAGPTRSDPDIVNEAETILRLSPDISAGRLVLRVVNGLMTLEGPAEQREALTTAAAQLRTIQGVRDVQVKVIDQGP
ncbi:MAG TPA: BON domain-containing protein [Nitrospiraceae bacterium]|nr:BON domain-containing protein [Nitrospiraceae bacterium]